MGQQASYKTLTGAFDHASHASQLTTTYTTVFSPAYIHVHRACKTLAQSFLWYMYVEWGESKSFDVLPAGSAHSMSSNHALLAWGEQWYYNVNVNTQN